MTCRREEEVCLTISFIKDLVRQSTFSNILRDSHLNNSTPLSWKSEGNWPARLSYFTVSNMWFCVFFSFFLEFHTLERPHCHSEWPHRGGYICTPAWISTPESCAHYDPGHPEGAVGREVRVPALLHGVLRGTGERVAIPLPLLSQRRRWAVCRHVHSPVKSRALKMPRCASLVICHTHLGKRHSSPCPWVRAFLLIILAYLHTQSRAIHSMPLALGVENKASTNPISRDSSPWLHSTHTVLPF